MTMWRLIIFICVTLNLATCFKDFTDESNYEDPPIRRVGGPGSFETLSSAYPFVVYLRIVFTKFPKGDGWCTGSIIHPNVVLTAGHCTCRRNYEHGREAEEFLSLRNSFVLVGANSASDAEIPRISRIVDVRIRPEFNHRFIGDVAMLRTAEDMVAMGGQVVNRGRMDQPEDPRVVQIVGYGANHALHNTNEHGALRSGDMQTADMNECKLVLDEEWALENKRYLCLTSYGAQSLHGDSGGPVLYKGKLIGVDKGGRTPKDYDYVDNPVGFKRYVLAERVSYYENWINDYIAQQDYPEQFRASEEFRVGDEYSSPSDKNLLSDDNIINTIGESYVMQPKGLTAILHKNGKETVVHPDGSISLSQPDGRTILVSQLNLTVLYPDGTKKILLPDKDVLVVKQDGTDIFVGPHGGTDSTNGKEATNHAIQKGNSALKIPFGDKTIVLPVSVNVVVKHERKG